jgi:hypothetical protein
LQAVNEQEWHIGNVYLQQIRLHSARFPVTDCSNSKLELHSPNQNKINTTNSKRERGHLRSIPGQPEVGWFDAVGLAIAARNGEDFIGE